MIYGDEGKSLGVKTISTKLSREEFTRLQYHCKSNGETINSFLKKIILTEIDNPQPDKISGKNKFEYNIQKDNFNWQVIFDDETIINIDKNLPVSTVEQLLESLKDVIDKRNTIIKKSIKNSVPIPRKLMRKTK